MSALQLNADASEDATLAERRAAEGLWADVWRRFKRNPIALAGFYTVCF